MLEPLPKFNRKLYLKPSILWGIRQEFPQKLGVLISILAVAFILIAWSLLSYTNWVDPRFLPPPTAVINSGIRMFTQERLLEDILASSSRVFWGFLAAGAVGIPVGILMGTFKSMENLFSPLVGPVRYMPMTAFVLLIILWAGLGEFAKVLIIFLGIVFYNAIMIADAVKFIPSEMLNVAYTLGANRRDVLSRVILPAIFPSILDTLRVNIAGAWNYLVIAELIAAEKGLGYKIVQSQRFFQTDKVLFCILIIGIIGLIIDYTFKILVKVLTPWAED